METQDPATKRLSRTRRRLFGAFLSAALIAASLIGIEVAAQIAYRYWHGNWLFAEPPQHHSQLMRRHPYLVGALKPNVDIKLGKGTVHHNALGFRGPEVLLKKPNGVTRIVLLGGSSTYGTRVTDEEAWFTFLQQDLGTSYEVINLGVPGYSSLEHLIQTAFWLSDLSPDIAIYYVGWNDVRNVHVKGLQADYSDFHGPSQFENLGLLLSENRGKMVSVYLLRKALFSRLFPEPEGQYTIEGTSDKLTTKMDSRALALYERNMGNIVAICRKLAIRPVLVPQLLNYDRLTADKPYYWIPYIKERDLKRAMTAYNDALRNLSQENRAEFVEQVLQEQFRSDDFADEGHFNALGGKKFAGILAAYLRQHSIN